MAAAGLNPNDVSLTSAGPWQRKPYTYSKNNNNNGRVEEKEITPQKYRLSNSQKDNMQQQQQRDMDRTASWSSNAGVEVVPPDYSMYGKDTVVKRIHIKTDTDARNYENMSGDVAGEKKIAAVALYTNMNCALVSVRTN